MKKAMEEYNIKSIDNEHIRISYVASGKPSVKVDLKSIKEKDSSLYNQLLAKYPNMLKVGLVIFHLEPKNLLN